MPGRRLLPETRSQIIILRDENYSIRQISNRLNLPKSSVFNTIKYFNETGAFAYPKPAGRKLSTTPATDRVILLASKRDPFASSSLIKSNLPAPAPSNRTIRRRLVKSGYKSYKPAKKPCLSKKNIKDRLAFCGKYRHWTEDQWARVMFSDETTICQFGAFSRHVRRPKGKRYDPHYTIKTVKNAPKVMVWGAITTAGRSGLWFMPKDTTINGRVYLTILQEKLQPFMEIRNCTFFQHDGAPCHQCKLVSTWLRGRNIEVIGPWPGNSPDINPIENCWHQVKCKVAQRNPTSVPDLIETIKDVWVNDITPEYCANLINSMPRRIATVLEQKGQHCKY